MTAAGACAEGRNILGTGEEALSDSIGIKGAAEPDETPTALVKERTSARDGVGDIVVDPIAEAVVMLCGSRCWLIVAFSLALAATACRILLLPTTDDAAGGAGLIVVASILLLASSSLDEVVLSEEAPSLGFGAVLRDLVDGGFAVAVAFASDAVDFARRSVSRASAGSDGFVIFFGRPRLRGLAWASMLMGVLLRKNS